MKPIRNLISGLVLAAALFSISCGKDNDPEPCNYAVELQAEITAVSNAATAFGSDPSQANCIAYRNALQAYVNAADDYSECSALAGQQAEYEAYLDSIQAEIDLLQC